MIGPKIGFRGVRVGPRTGAYGAAAPATIPTDATSGKGVPLTLADYALATSKVPSHTWGMQDAAGNPAATVGTALTATGASILYQQAVAGWSRKAIQIPELSGRRLAFTTGALMNPASGSVAWFAYIDVVSNTSTLPVVTLSNNATPMHCSVTIAPIATLRVATNTSNGVANPVTAGVIPWLLVYNKTAGTAKLYTSQEIITGVYNAGVGDGTVKGLGAAGSPATFNVLLAAGFDGANAEFDDAKARSFLQALGWTIPW